MDLEVHSKPPSYTVWRGIKYSCDSWVDQSHCTPTLHSTHHIMIKIPHSINKYSHYTWFPGNIEIIASAQILLAWLGPLRWRLRLVIPSAFRVQLPPLQQAASFCHSPSPASLAGSSSIQAKHDGMFKGVIIRWSAFGNDTLSFRVHQHCTNHFLWKGSVVGGCVCPRVHVTCPRVYVCPRVHGMHAIFGTYLISTWYGAFRNCCLHVLPHYQGLMFWKQCALQSSF